MTRLAFAPLIPLEWLIALGLAMLALAVWSFWAHAKGAWARTLVFILLLAALAGPITVHEIRSPLNDVAVIVMFPLPVATPEKTNTVSPPPST